MAEHQLTIQAHLVVNNKDQIITAIAIHKTASTTKATMPVHPHMTTLAR